MNDHAELTSLCQAKLIELASQLPTSEDQCRIRLELELSEIKKKNEAWYFLRFYNRGVKVEKNEHNLFICWLLGICPTVKIANSPSFNDAELPDIDVDYHPDVREYLKDDYTPKQFGKDYVCNITTYQTYGVKSSLADVAKVLGENKDEILSITTRLGMKDDEGDDVTFESMELSFDTIKEKKLKNLPLTKFDKLMVDLEEYRKKYPNVWDVAKRLVSATGIDWKDKYKYGKPPHRKKSMGMHASAVIVSSVKLNEFIPLVVPPGSREQGLQSSAWVEGLADTDCSSVGLIKFDYLSLEANAKIAECNRLIMERHGLDSICALPGLPNWSDTSYLNDPLALSLANEADLKGIFQFDSDGIRKMVKKGGVTSFDDLVAYSALYRPGPMDSGMHDEYCNRKNGRADYEIHPLLAPILGNTYGVIVYQEQCMRVLNVVGDIPLKDCEAVRKAISKKKRDKFEKYEKQFLEVGVKKLGLDYSEVKAIWDQMAAFAEYAFNKSMLIGTLVYSVDLNNNIVPKEIQDFVSGDRVLSIDELGNTVISEVVQLHDHNFIEGYEVHLDDGSLVTCSLDHKFLTDFGQKSLREIIGNDYYVLCDEICSNKGSYVKAKEVGRLENSLRIDCSNQEEMFRPLQDMSRVQNQSIYNGRMEVSLRSDIQDKYVNVRTSANLQKMSRVRVEDQRGWQRGDTHHPMSSCVEYLQRFNSAPEELFGVRFNQEEEHPQKESPCQQDERTSNCRIERGTQNFCTTGGSTSESEKFTFVAGTKFGRIRQVYGSSLEKSKAFQNGNVAPKPVELGYGANSVQGYAKTSGFSERQCVDRSGRVLSLQRKSTQEQDWSEAKDFSGCSSTRFDVKCRGDSSWQCYVTPFEHGVFHQFDRDNETGNLGLGASYAAISNTRRLVRRKIVRVVPVGKRQMYDLEVAINTHNFVLCNGVVTSNSHSCAYTYLSSRQLWQKAHYPLEFYASALRSLKTADKRIIDYIRDARRHNIPINKLDLNKSKLDFEISNDKIYYGFGKVLGIGTDVANRIVENQPYAGFQDFLDRFGTEAKVLQPLVCLNVFKEKDPLTMHFYYEAYKKALKQKTDRRTRNKKSVERYMGDLQKLLGEHKWEHGFDDNKMGTLRAWLNDDQWVKLCTLKKKYDNCLETFATKDSEKIKLSLEDFHPKAIKLNKSALKTFKTLKPILVDPEGAKAEDAFYGFSWMNPLERCPNYKGYTFEQFDIDCLRLENGQALPVEVLIESVEHTASKSGKMHYYKVRAADGVDGKSRTIRVWEHDYERFERVLQPGNCVRLRIYPPAISDKGEEIPGHSLEGVLPWKMRGRNPYGENPDFDTRAVLMKVVDSKIVEVTDDNLFDDVFTEDEEGENE